MAWRSNPTNRSGNDCQHTVPLATWNWGSNLLYAKIHFNNLTSTSLQLSLFESNEGHTPHFSLNFPRTTIHHHHLMIRSGRERSERQGGQEGAGGVHSGQPIGGPQRGEGQAGQSRAAATGHHGQREGGQERGSERSGQAGSAVQGRDAGLEEGGKSWHIWHRTQGKGEGQEGLQGKRHEKAGHQGAGSKGHRKAGRAGKGQRKAGGPGYMGSPVFRGKGFGWWGGVVPPAIPPVIPPFPQPPYPAVRMVYPPPAAYAGVPSQAHVQQRPQAGGTTWGAQGWKGEEHRRAWERIGEEERRLREREARVMGGADRVAEGWTEGQGRPRGGEAQAVEEQQREEADLWRRLERVERAERESARHRESGGRESCPPLQPFRQPPIPPEQESEMRERASRQIRGEATRLAERDRGVAARERKVRDEEEAVARGAPPVLPDPEGDTRPTDVEGPRMWRGGRRTGRGPERREGRLGRRGGSGAGWGSGKQGKQRGRRGLPAPSLSRRLRTGAQCRHRRSSMRRSRYRGGPGWSRGGGRGKWRSCSAT